MEAVEALVDCKASIWSRCSLRNGQLFTLKKNSKILLNLNWFALLLKFAFRKLPLYFVRPSVKQHALKKKELLSFNLYLPENKRYLLKAPVCEHAKCESCTSASYQPTIAFEVASQTSTLGVQNNLHNVNCT